MKNSPKNKGAKSSGRSNNIGSGFVVVVVLVAIAVLFVGSIVSRPANLAIDDCQIPKSSAKPMVVSKKIQAEIFVDGTPSMNGFVAYKDSRYGNTLKKLNTAIPEIWQTDQPKFYRFGDDARDVIEPVDFQDARKAIFYPTEAVESRYRFFNDSKILYAFSNAIKPSDDSLTIIVSDLTEKGANMNPVLPLLRDKYIKQGFAVGILAQRSEYKGKIYDIGLDNEQYEWDTVKKNSDPKFYRPFYVVVIGRYANVNHFYERLKESDKEFGNNGKFGSKFVIFDQRLISEPFLLNVKESTSSDPERSLTNINYENVVIEPDSAEKKERIQLLRLKPDASYKYAFKTSKSALLPNTIATFGDASQIKSKVEARRVDSKQFKNYDQAQELVKLESLKFANDKNEMAEFALQFNPQKNTPEGVYAINFSNFLDKPVSLPWLSEWNVEEKDGKDGSKTVDVKVLFNGLKDVVITANSDRAEADKLISKFCFVAEVR